MKKKDILKLLEYHKNVIDSKLGKRISYQTSVDMLANPLEGLYPDIKDLQEEFSVINSEFLKLEDKRRKSYEYIKNNRDEVDKIICDHPILLGTVFSLGINFCCALCHKNVNNSQSINRVHLNRYDVNAHDNAFYYQLTSYNEERDEYYRLYNVIHSMLMDRDDDEEIDFTKLFNKSYEKYNIGEITIDRTDIENSTKKYEVLVIEGSNQINIIDDIYINRSNNFSEDLIKYLKLAKNCVVHRISSDVAVDSYGVDKFQTIAELKRKLKGMSTKKVDLVIDFTRLFDCQIIDGKINVIDVVLNLNKMFSGSKIISVKRIQDEIYLYEELKNIIIDSSKGKKKVYKL